MARLPALLPFLFLVACGSDPGFDGTFTGTNPAGQRVTLVLKQDGKTLSGTARVEGIEAEISGTVEGDRASGTVRQARMGFEATFQATLKGDGLDWTYTITDAAGETHQLPIAFTRAEQASGSEARSDIDPQLVGRWYSEVGGTGISGNTVTTRIHSSLGADGSFEYGGAESLITLHDRRGGPGSTDSAGPAAVTRGQWKSEGSILFYKVEGGQWVPIGRYAISGSDLLVYTADGGKQLWSRE